MRRGIYLGVEGVGTNMPDTGGLIQYEIIELKNYHSGNQGGCSSTLNTPPPLPWIRPGSTIDTIAF